LSPKKDKQEFIICASIGGIGLLTLLIIPNLLGILILAICSIFAFIYKFLRKSEKTIKILGISFISIVGLAFIYFLIAMINAGVGYKLPGFLNRLFAQNRIMNNVTPVFETLFAKVGGKLVNFFGLTPTMINENVTWLETGMFEAQLIKEVGLIGTLLFAAFLGFAGWFILKYLKKSNDSDHVKSIFVVMILAFFIYESFNFVVSIAPHEESYGAFLRSPTLLSILFVLGYIFTSPFKEFKKEEKANA
jgi:hypothetical protein